MLPYSVVCNSPIQVQPVVVMQEVSIDLLQQQVRTFWVESWEVRVFLWGGGIPPHASDLNRGPPWGLSVPSSSNFFPLGLLLRLLSSIFSRMALPSGQLVRSLSADGSAGGEGVLYVSLSFPSPLSPPFPISSSTPPSSTAPTPSSLDLLGFLWW